MLLGQTTSQLGTQVSGVAIPLLAVLTLQASPLQLGLVTASGTLAFALIGLPAGAWIDTVRRRPMLVASDLIRAGLLATIPLAAWLGSFGIAQLIAVSLLSGFARVFFDVGYQSYLPSVLGRDKLLTGNSAMETVRASGQVLGPGIGGWLVAVAGAANVVLIQAVTFAASAASILAIRTREPAVPRQPHRPRIRIQIMVGLRVVARTRVLRATALTSAAGNFSFAMASAVSVIFMVRTVGLSPVAVGLVVALGSVTVMIGAALTPRLARRVGSVRIIWLSLAVTGPFTLLGPLAQPGWLTGLLVLGTAAGELGQIVYAITNVTLRQRHCPDRMLGRVNATMRFLMMSLFPLGALLGGVLGELIGPRSTLLLAAAIITLSPIPVHRALRHHRDLDDIPAWTTGVCHARHVPVDGDVVVRALGSLARGRAGEALMVLTSAGGAGSRLRGELAEYLERRRDGRVYDEPAAFQAFISGGGNHALYRALVARMAAAYRDRRVRTVLDIGCGDGRAVVPAAVQLGRDAPEVELVDPSAALLADAEAAARLVGLRVRPYHGTVQSLLADAPDRTWDLAESTFALHAVEPVERAGVLAALRRVAGTLLVAEFDVPAMAHGSPEHLASLAERYARGLDEYPDSLVAQGFLMPVLVGQLEPGQIRHTWEQPAADWATQLTAAGWRDVTVTPLTDYWWAPAVLFTARA